MRLAGYAETSVVPLALIAPIPRDLDRRPEEPLHLVPKTPNRPVLSPSNVEAELRHEAQRTDLTCLKALDLERFPGELYSGVGRGMAGPESQRTAVLKDSKAES